MPASLCLRLPTTVALSSFLMPDLITDLRRTMSRGFLQLKDAHNPFPPSHFLRSPKHKKASIAIPLSQYVVGPGLHCLRPLHLLWLWPANLSYKSAWAGELNCETRQCWTWAAHGHSDPGIRGDFIFDNGPWQLDAEGEDTAVLPSAESRDGVNGTVELKSRTWSPGKDFLPSPSHSPVLFLSVGT